MCRSDRPGKARGLTLLEMILFIVVLGVAGVVLLTTLSSPLTGAGTQTAAMEATQVAQARMELVLGQKREGGYPATYDDDAQCGQELDPCASGGLGAAWCDTGGWTVSTECTDWSGDVNRQCYVVAVVTAVNDGTQRSVRALFTNLDEACS